jgi:Carboxypeptidase regulatory-like domain
MANIKTIVLDWIYTGLSPRLYLRRTADNMLFDGNPIVLNFVTNPSVYPTMQADPVIPGRYYYSFTTPLLDGEYTYTIFDPTHNVNIGTGKEWSYLDQWASADVSTSFLPTTAELQGGGTVTIVLGVDLVSITLVDSTSNLPITGATIVIRNSGDTLSLARITTDSNGLAQIYLNDGLYVLRIQKEGYTFATSISLNVVGDTSATYTGLSIVPPVIILPGKQTVYGYFYKLDGTPDDGITVTAVIPLQSLTPGQTGLLSSNKITAQTDENGFFQMQLLFGILVRFVITNYGSKDVVITTDATKTIQSYYGL